MIKYQISHQIDQICELEKHIIQYICYNYSGQNVGFGLLTQFPCDVV